MNIIIKCNQSTFGTRENEIPNKTSDPVGYFRHVILNDIESIINAANTFKFNYNGITEEYRSRGDVPQVTLSDVMEMCEKKHEENGDVHLTYGVSFCDSEGYPNIYSGKPEDTIQIYVMVEDDRLPQQIELVRMKKSIDTSTGKDVYIVKREDLWNAADTIAEDIATYSGYLCDDYNDYYKDSKYFNRYDD